MRSLLLPSLFAGTKYVVVLLFFIPAFACATPYQAKGLTGGSSYTRLDQHALQVSFRGKYGAQTFLFS